MSNKNVDNSSSVNNSRSVDNSSYVYNSSYVNNSRSVNNSNSVYNSNSVDNSSSIRFLYNAYFCYDIGFKEYVVFNKEVGKERFNEVYNKIESIMSPNLQMKDENFSNEWKKNIKKEQWIELSKIPEFDRKVVESIVGFELPLDDSEEEVKEMTVKEISKELGKKYLK